MDRPLLSQRTTLVFLLASLAGATTGALTALAGEGTPRGVLAGLVAAGLAVRFFDRLVAGEPDTGGPRRHADARTGKGAGHG
ncbi:hypothetical protein M1P56_14935 [Streptomyces sp. HU2014]|uniref:Uncharacterized protein n=1 Tax=Streptomyces albireticuli TaxID=1940 RepID=A0A1Z2LD80_9ACTN|nr:MULTISPECIES: hypothetical protein [Streptomyces]ARZ72178.1 hypothetical protein SMD11_6602 [Streptomyces albireticuli]UQI45552.1 hypothetical protein M1P56_14935 [Streptomyces sp. HU2014]